MLDRYNQVVETERALEEENKQLEQDLKNTSPNDAYSNNLSDNSGSYKKVKESFKMDLFNSSYSSTENDDTGKDNHFCPTCQKLFAYNINYSGSNLEQLLHDEIIGFEQKINQILSSKYESFTKILQILQSAILQVLNVKFDLYTYGSYANGLNMPWSDIDLLIEFIDEDNNIAYMEQLEIGLAKIKTFDEIKFIKGATIPVLKIKTNDEFGETKIDITVKGLRHSGLNCVSLIKQYIVYYRPLRPITLILKQLLHITELNDPYQGGLSSYGLILMITGFIQSLIVKNIYIEYENNYGKLLLEFLKFYSSGFDYNNCKVAPSFPDNIQNIYPHVRSLETVWCL